MSPEKQRSPVWDALDAIADPVAYNERQRRQKELEDRFLSLVPPIGPLGTSTSTVSTAQAKTMTMADLDAMIEAVEKLGEEPIGQWMRRQGHPPELHLLILPSSMKPVDGPDVWPDYVYWVSWVERPLFVRRASWPSLAAWPGGPR